MGGDPVNADLEILIDGLSDADQHTVCEGSPFDERPYYMITPTGEVTRND